MAAAVLQAGRIGGVPSPTITIRVEPELLARIDAEMRRTGETRTAWMRSAIESHIERKSALPKPAAARPKPSRAAVARTSMCEHRMKPEQFCRRCDS